MKNDLKQMLIGIPLLWAFIAIAGYGLYYFEEYPIAWLLIIFILTPIAILTRNYLKDRNRKKDA